MADPWSNDALSCPFCTFKDSDSDFLLQHINLLHPEDENASYLVREGKELPPFRPESSHHAEGASDEWIECACGEMCPLADFSMHLDLHEAENISDIESSTTAAAQPASPTHYSFSEVDTSGKMATDDVYRDRVALSRPLFQQAVPYSEPLYVEASTAQQSLELQQTLQNIYSEDTALLAVPATKRLGKAELGPFYNEERMPAAIREILEKGGRIITKNHIGRDGRLLKVQSVSNEVKGIIPVLAQCSAQDNEVVRAYFCHPDVTDVFKLSREGGFCGYRNIQTVISYIQETMAEGYQQFLGPIPSIFQLQDMIEIAWDYGYNASGRAETGGIRGTRKFIGTPEAQALFQSKNIGCEADAFSSKVVDDKGHARTERKLPAYRGLLAAVENYFLESRPDLSKKVIRTSLPPVYFQHPGHSMTIVGFERRRDGSANLLVLDPIFKPSPAVTRLIGAFFRIAHPDRLLKAHRRGEAYLKRYSNFEILRLTARVPPRAAWHGS